MNAVDHEDKNREFDGFAGQYRELLKDPIREAFTKDSGFFAERKRQVFAAFFARQGMDPHRMRWLDVGCGQGELMSMAQADFAGSAGCDPSAEMLARAGNPNVRVQRTPTSIPYPDESFEFVSAVCVYHHVLPADRDALTRDIFRVLVPGGIFAMVEHNPLNPVTQIIVRRCPVDADAQLLLGRLARRLMHRQGFRNMGMDFFLFLPQGLTRRFPWVEKMLRKFPMGGQYCSFGFKPK
ncbi:class I SAM-dependent methyltransferase [Geothrix oryzisoli]|uniref:class I SAM-dependent methyltransferase n=1 Tax=Geothrix oryzisoli TaxID=2922721 RepID=UPI001FAD072E|nr:class I SAM-dependent methyltransferase [Geothrix oryzisoli]